MASVSIPSATPFLKPLQLSFNLRSLNPFQRADLAMDLGTANTLIYARQRGMLVNAPSVVAVDERTGKAVAVGHKAKEIYGKTSNVTRCLRPMKDGVIADFEMTSLMISHMLKEARPSLFIRPRIVIGVPSGITQVEKRAVIEAALASGLREAILVEEPMAAAIGMGLPINKPIGNMVVDIGGGTTEVAIIALNGTVYSRSIRVAGDEMDEAIQRHLKRLYGIEVGIFEAERLKMVMGSALPFSTPRSALVYGRDIATGMPIKTEIGDGVIREALHEPLSVIVSAVTDALESTSAEIAQDIISQGIYLAGGGALLKGLARRLTDETGILFHRANDPLSCVVRGVAQVVENLKGMREVCIN